MFKKTIFLLIFLSLVSCFFGSSQGFLDSRDGHIYESVGFDPGKRPNEFELQHLGPAKTKGLKEMQEANPGYLNYLKPIKQRAVRRPTSPAKNTPRTRQNPGAEPYQNPYLYSPPPIYPYRE